MLTLAPRFQELYDTSCAYLWALAQDSKGNLYAGGGPGAKVFRLAPGGGKKTVAELEGLEIHALAVDKEDRLYAATSPDGKIYRVLPERQVRSLLRSQGQVHLGRWPSTPTATCSSPPATAARYIRFPPTAKAGCSSRPTRRTRARWSMDADGNLIVGTEPGGLVIRVSPAGEGFVLYQMSKREVTAVAVAPDGAVWAAAVGNKRAGAVRPGQPRNRLPPGRLRHPRPRPAPLPRCGSLPPSRPPPWPGAHERLRRQRGLPHRPRRQSAQDVDPRAATSSMPSPSTRAAAPCSAPATRAISTASIPPPCTPPCSMAPPPRSRASTGAATAASSP